jgi:hypothetical protein
MSGKWISIERPPCGRAFAVSVASWARAMARTMDSPRPWWSSTRVRSSRWKGSKRRWTCSGGITGPVFAMETTALSPSTRVEISTLPPGTL